MAYYEKCKVIYMIMCIPLQVTLIFRAAGTPSSFFLYQGCSAVYSAFKETGIEAERWL